MDIKQFVYFAAAVEAGSITRAAIRLGISQPAISRRIAALEQEMGATLLDRHGTGIVPTEAGQLVLAHAREIQRRLDTLRDELAALRTTPGGEVRLGMTPAMAEAVGAILVGRLRREFPNVLVSLHEGFGGHLRDWLVDGVLDAAIIYEPPVSHHLLCEDLLLEDLMLIGPAGDRHVAAPTVPFRMLGELPLVLPGTVHSLRRLVEREAARLRLSLSVIAEVDSLCSLREMVRAGIGYTVAGAAPFRLQLKAGVLAASRLVEPTVQRRMALTTSVGRPLSPAARALVSLTRQEIRSLVRKGTWPGRLPA